MQNIQIFAENGKVKIYVDGVLLSGVRSFSVRYVQGEPVQVDIAAEAGTEKQPPRILH